MSHRCTTVIVVVMLSVAWASAAAAQSAPPSSRWYDIGKPHVAKRGSGVVLVQTITSTASKQRNWALVDMDGPEGSEPCDWLKILEPNQAYRFECPLKNAAGQKYIVRVRVFSDAKLEDRETHYVPELTVASTQVTEAPSAGSAPASVPVGTFESIDTPLPATFKPTWYRRVDKGFGMRAYENSGDLTVSADEIVFVDGSKTVRIPYARVQSVRWEPLPNDIANHWIVVRFTNDDGKPDGVAFRDGARMGTRGNSGPIYQAVRRAKK